MLRLRPKSTCLKKLDIFVKTEQNKTRRSRQHHHLVNNKLPQKLARYIHSTRNDQKHPSAIYLLDAMLQLFIIVRISIRKCIIVAERGLTH